MRIRPALALAMFAGACGSSDTGLIDHITVTPSVDTLVPTQNGHLTASAIAANGDTLFAAITWTSDAPAIATVNVGGGIYAVSNGTATITASSGGKSATALVIVVGPAAPRIFTDIVGGYGDHVCGLRPSGAAWCWGQNRFGELGDGTTTSRTIPTPVNSDLQFTALAIGGDHTCGLVAAGTLYCWGDNEAGELGDGSLAMHATPAIAAPGLSFTAVAAGLFHTCGIATTGITYCWGKNQAGQLGNGAVTNRELQPVVVGGGHTFVQIASSSEHTCGIDTSGFAWCWGENLKGELGDQSFTSRSLPAAVAGGLHFSQLSVGSKHTCGVTTNNNGYVYCWGWNNVGQLGNGIGVFTDSSSTVPVAVAGQIGFSQIALGISHTCGAGVGPANCWGSNAFGQLGINDVVTAAVSAPRTVATSVGFRKLAVAGNAVCGLTSNGTVYCWGDNVFGQLGDSSTTRRYAPTRLH